MYCNSKRPEENVPRSRTLACYPYVPNQNPTSRKFKQRPDRSVPFSNRTSRKFRPCPVENVQNFPKCPGISPSVPKSTEIAPSPSPSPSPLSDVHFSDFVTLRNVRSTYCACAMSGQYEWLSQLMEPRTRCRCSASNFPLSMTPSSSCPYLCLFSRPCSSSVAVQA